MPDKESGGVELKGHENCSEPYVTCKDDSSSQSGGQKGKVDGLLQASHSLGSAPSPTISIVISQPEGIPNPKGEVDGLLQASHVLGSASSPTISIMISQPEDIPSPKAVISRDDKISAAAAAKKDSLQRSDSYQEQCRICQQESEEPLINLGCKCRGELAKAHRSCIELWFHTRGSNKCEICQQAAANVPFPECQPSTNYWVWRIESANGVYSEHRRGCLSPLWLAFTILIGGLLLDVLISVTLGVSALPVNIIIGILIVLGLGTALRLALECCHHLGAQRNRQRAEATANPGYHPAERTWGTWFQML